VAVGVLAEPAAHLADRDAAAAGVDASLRPERVVDLFARGAGRYAATLLTLVGRG
jgi:hypothetical protein